MENENNNTSVNNTNEEEKISLDTEVNPSVNSISTQTPVYTNKTYKKGNKGLVVFLLLLIFILLAVLGYFVYDKYIKNKNLEAPKTNEVDNKEDVYGYAILNYNYGSSGSKIVELHKKSNDYVIYSTIDDCDKDECSIPYSSDPSLFNALFIDDNYLYFIVNKKENDSLSRNIIQYNINTKEKKEISQPIDGDFCSFLKIEKSVCSPILYRYGYIDDDIDVWNNFLRNKNVSGYQINYYKNGTDLVVKVEYKEVPFGFDSFITKITYGSKDVCQANDNHYCSLLYSFDENYIYYYKFSLTNGGYTTDQHYYKYNIKTGESEEISKSDEIYVLDGRNNDIYLMKDSYTINYFEKTTNINDRIIGYAVLENVNYINKDTALVELDSKGNNRIIASYHEKTDNDEIQYIDRDSISYSNNKLYYVVRKSKSQDMIMEYDLTTKELQQVESKIGSNDYFEFANLSSDFWIMFNGKKLTNTKKCVAFGGGGCFGYESKIVYGDETICETNNNIYGCTLGYSKDSNYIFYRLIGESPTQSYKYDVNTGEKTQLAINSADDYGISFYTYTKIYYVNK